MSTALDKYVPELDGSNYQLWSCKMKAYLQSMDLWHIVSGLTPRPVPAAAVATPEEATQILNWDISDERAQGTITLRLAPWVFDRIQILPTGMDRNANNVWARLQTFYHAVSPSQVFALFREVLNYRVDVSRNLQPQLDNLDSLYQRLATENVNIPDFLRAMMLFAALPSSWEAPIIVTVMAGGQVAGITLENTKTTIIRYADAERAKNIGKRPPKVHKISAVAILSQEGEVNPLKPNKPPKHHPVAYYSATFTPTERNYDIYERELLAIIKAITHWRPYLIWTKEPFTIHTDHANLLYWKSPRKLNRRTARWHSELQDYHFELKHVPGKLHTAADALSRPPRADQGALDNQEMTMIPEPTFIKVLNEDSPGSLEHRITMCQQHYLSTMKLWETSGAIEQHLTNTQTMWKDTLKGRLVVPPDNDIRRQIMNIWHEGPTGGHPGRDETTRRIEEHYYWPGARVWIADYIKGCASCQQNKNLTTRQKTPLYRIPVEANPAPITHIAIDLITGLPKSGGYDAILTIVDHGCSRAAIFLPCTTNITGAQIARLYFDNVYRWFGLPTRIISDRDPRFTSHFGKALTKSLGIQQNLSTAYHPQTDGLSERKNQWVEQYLRLIATN